VIINDKEKIMVIEKRDLDFALSAFLRSYLFYTKNEPPDKVTISKVPDIKNYQTGKPIAVEYVEYVPQEGAVEPEEALMAQPEEAKAEEAPVQELAEDEVCPLCGKPSPGGVEHQECMDREAALADQPPIHVEPLPDVPPTEPLHEPPTGKGAELRRKLESENEA
jgi:hypothetical protein